MDFASLGTLEQVVTITGWPSYVWGVACMSFIIGFLAFPIVLFLALAYFMLQRPRPRLEEKEVFTESKAFNLGQMGGKENIPLRIKRMKAEGLCGLSPDGTSNVYVVASINHSGGQKSPVVTSVNPQWDQQMSLTVAHPERSVLILEVWHRAWRSWNSEFLGMATVGLDSKNIERDGGEKTLTLELQHRMKRKMSDAVKGTISIDFAYGKPDGSSLSKIVEEAKVSPDVYARVPFRALGIVPRPYRSVDDCNGLNEFLHSAFMKMTGWKKMFEHVSTKIQMKLTDLVKKKDIDVVSHIELKGLNIGNSPPVIKRLRVVPASGDIQAPPSSQDVYEMALEYTGGFTIMVSTELLVKWPVERMVLITVSVTVQSLGAKLAVSWTSSEDGRPIVRFTLLEEPVIDLGIDIAPGKDTVEDGSWPKMRSMLSRLIHKKIKKSVSEICREKLIYPMWDSVDVDDPEISIPVSKLEEHVARTAKEQGIDPSQANTFARSPSSSSIGGASPQLQRATSMLDSVFEDVEADRVTVVIVSAKDLIACDKNGFSDPFCTVSLEGKTQRTKVRKKTLDPVWSESFNFEVRDPSSAELIVDIFDMDLIGKDYMGSVVVPLSRLEKGQVVAQSYPLHTRQGMGDVKNVTGELELFIEYATPQAQADAGSMASPGLSRSQTMRDRAPSPSETTFKPVAKPPSPAPGAGSVKNLNTLVQTSKKDLTERGPSRFRVIIHSATDVIPCDKNGFSDPFCQLQLGGKIMKTRVKKRTLNPVWEEQFDFIVSDIRNEELKVDMFDKDLIGKDYMGSVTIPVDKVVNSQRQEYPLYCRLGMPPVPNLHGKMDVTIINMADGGQVVPSPVPTKNSEPSPPTSPVNEGGSESPTSYGSHGRPPPHTMARSRTDDALSTLEAANSSKPIYRGHSDVAQRVSVRLVSASGVIACDKNGYSDPYCVLEIEGKTFKSRVKKKTLNPVWDEVFDFVVRDVDNTELKIDMWDSDLIGKDYMGSVVIPLNTIEGSLQGHFPLRVREGMEPVPHLKGLMLLHVSFSDDKLKPPPTLSLQSSDERMGSTGSLPVLKEQFEAEAGSSGSPSPAPTRMLSEKMMQSKKIDVKIVSASNVMACDRNGFSDPFCTVSVRGNSFKTSIKKKTLNPTWNETFQFWVEQPESAQIIVDMFDMDMIGKDYMGSVVMNLQDFLGEAKGKVSRPFVRREGMPDTEVKGTLYFEVVVEPDPDEMMMLEGLVRGAQTMAQRKKATKLKNEDGDGQMQKANVVAASNEIIRELELRREIEAQKAKSLELEAEANVQKQQLELDKERAIMAEQKLRERQRDHEIESLSRTLLTLEASVSDLQAAVVNSRDHIAWRKKENQDLEKENSILRGRLRAANATKDERSMQLQVKVKEMEKELVTKQNLLIQLQQREDFLLRELGTSTDATPLIDGVVDVHLDDSDSVGSENGEAQKETSPEPKPRMSQSPSITLRQASSESLDQPQFPRSPPPFHKQSTIEVNVVSAQNVVACDRNGFSDPYCVVTVDEHQFKTKVRKKTLNPVWSEIFTVTVDDHREHKLYVDMWDQDFIGRDYMGSVIIDLETITPGEPAQRSYPLYMRDDIKHKTESVSGEIFLGISIESVRKAVQDAPAQSTRRFPSLASITGSMSNILEGAKDSIKPRLAPDDKSPSALSLTSHNSDDYEQAPVTAEQVAGVVDYMTRMLKSKRLVDNVQSMRLTLERAVSVRDGERQRALALQIESQRYAKQVDLMRVRLEDTLHTHQKETNTLKETQEEQKKLLANAEEKIMSQEEELVKRDKTISEANGKLTEQGFTLKQLEGTVTSQRSRIEAMEEEEQRLHEEISELKNDFETKSYELAKGLREVGEEFASVIMHTTKIVGKSKGLETECHRQQNEIEAYRETLLNVESALEQKEMQLKFALENECLEIQRQSHVHSMEDVKRRALVERLQMRVAEVETKLYVSESKSVELFDHHTNTVMGLDQSLRYSTHEMKQRIQDLERDRMVLQEQLVAVNAKMKEKEMAYKDLERTNKILTEELKEVGGGMQALAQEIHTLTRRNETLELESAKYQRVHMKMLEATDNTETARYIAEEVEKTTSQILDELEDAAPTAEPEEMITRIASARKFVTRLSSSINRSRTRARVNGTPLSRNDIPTREEPVSGVAAGPEAAPMLSSPPTRDMSLRVSQLERQPQTRPHVGDEESAVDQRHSAGGVEENGSGSHGRRSQPPEREQEFNPSRLNNDDNSPTKMGSAPSTPPVAKVRGQKEASPAQMALNKWRSKWSAVNSLNSGRSSRS